MSWLKGVVCVVLCASALSVSGENLNNCVQISNTKFDSCINNSGMSMRITNGCNVTVNTEFCLQRKNGKWDCGRDSSLAAGRHTTYYTCEATGKYEWIACRENENCQIRNIPR